MQKTGQHEKAFNALGDPMRRLIFEKLRSRPLSVADIAHGLPVSRPAVSQHIRILKDARLIRVRRSGTRNFCEIDPDGVLAMRIYLDNFWDTALAAFKTVAENQTDDE
ncbi:MAG TPA: metalloregulator ArsR/SmtB family transcription factor [Mucilaginibacter sp.]|nr:metalloregulator ArsR/SmtB family transcription factor [Mucilaginibacter sp.]